MPTIQSMILSGQVVLGVTKVKLPCWAEPGYFIPTKYSSPSEVLGTTVYADGSTEEDDVWYDGDGWELYVSPVPNLQLEVGKCYRTRDGRKVHIVYKCPGDYTYPYLGVFDSTIRTVIYRPDGSWGEGPDDDDLISEWKEPYTVKGWVALYHNGTGTSSIYPELSMVKQLFPEADAYVHVTGSSDVLPDGEE